MDYFRVLLISLCCLCMQNAFAGIYKWVDENGHVQFSDRPPKSKKAVEDISKKKKPKKKVVNRVLKTSPIQSRNSTSNPLQDSIILKIRQLLVRGQYDELNLILDRYQTAFESNISKEENLFTAYDAFEINDKSYESYLNAWIKSTPNYYQPYVARAKYYYRMAWLARGSRWASETKEKQFSEMNAYLDKEEKDINKAIRINKKSIIPYHLLIGIANIRGQGGCDFGLVLADNDNEFIKILQKFESELMSSDNGCVMLVAHSKNNPDNYIVAGVNDKKVFKKKWLDNHKSELFLELQKEEKNKNKIIGFLTSMLGITQTYSEEEIAMKKGLMISPLSYRIRTKYLNAITPRWGGTYEKMKNYADNSLEYVSDNPRLKLLGGLVYAEAGDAQVLVRKYTLAEEYYNTALTFGENHTVLYDRGKNSYRQDKYSEALKDLNRAIELYPEKGEYYNWRSKAYSMLKQYNKAVLDIERANKLKPNDKSIKKQSEWLSSKLTRLGYELGKTRKTKKAIKNFDAALQINAKDDEVFHRRARAYIDKYKYDLALSDIKKAIELNPKEFNYYQLIDWILAKRKDWEQIIDYWDKYIALDPGNSRAYLERGGAYFHKGDMKSAVSNAKMAADLGNPDGKETYEKYKHRVR